MKKQNWYTFKECQRSVYKNEKQFNKLKYIVYKSCKFQQLLKMLKAVYLENATRKGN